MISHSRPWVTDADATQVAAWAQSGQLLGGFDDAALAGLLAPSDTRCFFFPSGREALRAALSSLALPEGGEVIVQTYVCDAVLWAIEACGLVPALCDLDDGWTCSPATVASVLSPRSVAIVLAPPFGFAQPARAFRQFGLPVVSDRCQSAPNPDAYDADGHATVLSFHPTKYVTGAGGGAVLTQRMDCLDALRRGEAAQRQCAPWSNLQKALLASQLARLHEFEARRDVIFRTLRDCLPAALSTRMENNRSVAPGRMFRFVVDAEEPFEVLKERFANSGIAVRRGVDTLAHASRGFLDAGFPSAMARFESTLSLPFYPALSDSELARVLDVADDLL
jgi:dTDP-4-amino-4,6-dideoxygalactose transaminase